jgi:hypothetical protein
MRTVQVTKYGIAYLKLIFRLKYQKQSLPKRIEEALEELRLVPAKLEQKAPVPDCKMKLVTDVEHHGMGDGEEISQIDVGKPMRLEFTLTPETGKFLK